jgi:metal-responsive CopG/Arc/MetJ family transcriptional regulator
MLDEKKLIIKPKRVKGEDGYKVFSIRIKEDIVDRIDDISRQTGRSRNELIGTFLEYALDHCVVADDEK